MQLICLVNIHGLFHLKKIISKGRKPNKILVDQGSEFYNNCFKDFLKINNIEMYPIAERFIRTLKTRFLST